MVAVNGFRIVKWKCIRCGKEIPNAHALLKHPLTADVLKVHALELHECDQGKVKK